MKDNPSESGNFKFILSHIPCSSYITMEITGHMEGMVFKNNTLKMLAYLTSMSLKKLLVDAREMKFITSDDCNWLEKTFLPFATDNGLKAVCFIKPADYHTRNC